MKNELKKRGLTVTGNKQELIDRLEEAIQSGRIDSIEYYWFKNQFGSENQALVAWFASCTLIIMFY